MAMKAFLGVCWTLGLAVQLMGHADHADGRGELSTDPAGNEMTARESSQLAAGWAGQAPFLFRYRADLSGLPPETGSALPQAHGGFAVDPLSGEVFFGLKGLGIIWMSNDLSEKRVLPVTDERLLEGNFHNVTLLRDSAGQRFLALPDNEKGRVFVTTDAGQVVQVLNTPKEVNAYYADGGPFRPTDAEFARRRLYVTDGYSPGNYILTADPLRGRWLDRPWFGGKAKAGEFGRFSTAHGIAINPATRRLEIADRELSRIQSFDLNGTFLGNVELPAGALPCDVDHHAGFTLVGCLKGPGEQTPASLYVLDHQGTVVSEVAPGRHFGLKLFTHIHNATWKPVVDTEALFVLVTAWNPGGFAVLEVRSAR